MEEYVAYAGSQDHGAKHLYGGGDAVGHVVGVVGRGKPAEVHPSDEHTPEGHHVAHRPCGIHAFGKHVVKPAGGLCHGHHDDEVEE